MFKRINIFLYTLCLVMTSCFDIVEEIQLNKNGGGKIEYNINLSQSKYQLSSLMLLDSIEGRKVPSIADLDKKLRAFVEEIKSQPGISSGKYTPDHDRFIYKLDFEFTDVNLLNSAIQNTHLIKKNPSLALSFFFEYEDGKFNRNFPKNIDPDHKVKEEYKLKLEQAKFISVFRSQGALHTENNNLIASKNKEAFMLKSNCRNLIDSTEALNYSIDIE